MFNYFATSSIFRRGTKATYIQYINKDGVPKKLLLSYRDGVADCLPDILAVLQADPEGLLSIKNDVALMVHEGRTMVLLRISATCITVNRRMGTRRTSTSMLRDMANAVAELVNGKVESYSLQPIC